MTLNPLKITINFLTLHTLRSCAVDPVQKQDVKSNVRCDQAQTQLRAADAAVGGNEFICRIREKAQILQADLRRAEKGDAMRSATRIDHQATDVSTQKKHGLVARRHNPMTKTAYDLLLRFHGDGVIGRVCYPGFLQTRRNGPTGPVRSWPQQ